MSAFSNYAAFKATMEALQAGSATPDQQRACHAHILEVKQQHNRGLREAERDARDAYREGRSNADADARSEPHGTY
jgi:hypothetical protein